MSTNPQPRDFNMERRVVGTRLGRYMVGPRLGSGGTASVFLGRLVGPHSFERLAALKVIHEHLLDEKDFVNMFIDEANLAVRLSHPSVVHAYELGREGEALFMAMEYLHGQPLAVFQRVLKDRGELVGFALSAWIAARVAHGLHHAHELKDDAGERLGLVHRDVSPQNVFLTYDGQVKLIDFGIARAEGRIAKTTLGRIKGKLSYMAPEQALGSSFDHRVDVFALGATLFEAAVGRRLFGGQDETDTLQALLVDEIPDPAEENPSFPAELSRILRKALARNPTDRYETAGEMAYDLDEFVHECRAGGLSALLSERMEDLLREQKASQAATIAEFRTESENFVETERPTPASLGTAEGATKRPFPRLVLVGGVVLTLALGTGLILATRNDSPLPVVSPSRNSVVFDVSVQPPVEAVIRIDNKVIQDRPARVSLAKGDTPVEVYAEAAGFVPARLTVVPDRDRFLIIPLIREIPAVASVTPQAADASVEDASKPVATHKPVVRKRDAGAKPPGTGSLVTDYPFKD